MPFDVFISRSQKDEAAVQAIFNALEAGGIRCWLATRDIAPGAMFGNEIIRALDETRVFVVVVSSNAMVSRHVVREVERADNRGRPILPIRIHDVVLKGNLEYFLSALQWETVSNPPSKPELDRIVSHVRRLLSSDEVARSNSETVAERVGSSRNTVPARVRRAVFAGIAAVVLIVLALLTRARLGDRGGPASDAGNIIRTNEAAAEQSKLYSTADEESLTSRSPERDSPVTSADGAATRTSQATRSVLASPPVPARVRPATYDIRLESEPKGALVTWQGTPLGRTPFVHEGVEVGVFDVAFELDGYSVHAETLHVGPGERQQLFAELRPLRAQLTISASPRVAIFIDGVELGSPFPSNEPVDVAAGKHMLRATHPNWGLWEKTVAIAAGEHERIAFDFDRTYQVTITSEPLYAEVRVDGVATGKYTPTVLSLHPGQRSISVRKDGYSLEGLSRTITVDEATMPLEFTLRKIP